MPNEAVSTRRLLLLLTGGVVYVTSFFLPAVNTLEGWRCALGPFRLLKQPAELINPFSLLAIATALLNPLILVYAACWIVRAPIGRRRAYALGAILLIVVSRVFLALMALDSRRPDAGISVAISIEAGYYLWIGGVLLMVGWDAIDAARSFLRAHRQ